MHRNYKIIKEKEQKGKRKVKALNTILEEQIQMI